MKSGKYWHYWDSCIFLHWLSDPKKDAAVVDGIEDIVRSVEKGEAGIITSVITRIEILRSRMDQKTADSFSKLFSRPAIQQVNVDPRIAKMAHDIRAFYDAQKRRFFTPDCIHLATAIIYEADEMNTLDGSGERKRPNDLIPLSGNIMDGQFAMSIRKPLRVQGSILAGAKPLLIETVKYDEKASGKADQAGASGQNPTAVESGRRAIGPVADTTGAEKAVKPKGQA